MEMIWRREILRCLRVNNTLSICLRKELYSDKLRVQTKITPNPVRWSFLPYIFWVMLMITSQSPYNFTKVDWFWYIFCISTSVNFRSSNLFVFPISSKLRCIVYAVLPHTNGAASWLTLADRVIAMVCYTGAWMLLHQQSMAPHLQGRMHVCSLTIEECTMAPM